VACTRRDFLQLIPATVGAGALSSLGSACGPAPRVEGTVIVMSGRALLRYADFPRLTQVGGGVLVETNGRMPLVVVRIGERAAAALSAVCTYASCLLEYLEVTQEVHCPCDGSAFGLNGMVQQGPAATALASFAASVGTDGITVMLE
jgi:nitrite reductase/ring-hydroxylating ferredoxin subunit